MSDETREPLTIYTAPRNLGVLNEQTSHTLRQIAHALGHLSQPDHMVAWHRAPSHEARAKIVLDCLELWDKEHPGEYKGPVISAGPTPQSSLQPQHTETPTPMNQPPNFGQQQQQQMQPPQYPPQQGFAQPPLPPQHANGFQQQPPQMQPQQGFHQPPPFAAPPQQPGFAPPQQAPQQFAPPQAPQQPFQQQPPQFAPPPPPQQQQQQQQQFAQQGPPPFAPPGGFAPPQIVPGPPPGSPGTVPMAPPPPQQPLFQPPGSPSQVDPGAQAFAQSAAAPEAPKTRNKRSPTAAAAPSGDNGDVLQALAELKAINQALSDRLERVEQMTAMMLSGVMLTLPPQLQLSEANTWSKLMDYASNVKNALLATNIPKG